MDSAIIRTFELTKTDIVFWADENGDTLMQAKGICQGLELANVTQVVQRHVDIEYRRQVAIGKGMPAWFVTYEGFIQLVFASKSQYAKSFQKWVFSVIKTIMTTGAYTAKPDDSQHFNPFGIKLQLQEAQSKAVARLSRCLDGDASHEDISAVTSAIDITRKAIQDATLIDNQLTKADLEAEFLIAVEARLRDIDTGKGYITPRDAKRKTRLVSSGDHARKLFRVFVAQGKATFDEELSQFRWI